MLRQRRTRLEQLEARTLFSGTPTLIAGPPTTGANNEPVQNMSLFTPVGDNIFFQGRTATQGDALWKLDTATDVASLVKDFRPGPVLTGIDTIVNVDEVAYVVEGRNERILWTSDGTPDGTQQIGPLTFPGGLVLGGDIYGVDTQGLSLPWTFRVDKFDTESQAITTVASVQSDAITPRMRPWTQTVVADRWLYFETGSDPNKEGESLWVTDGVNGTTVRLAHERFTRIVGTIGDTVLFSGGTFETGIELWATDGSEVGTKPIKDINPGAASSNSSTGVVVNGYVYFAGDDGNGRKLWRSNGTAAGTQRVFASNAVPGDSNPVPLAALGNLLVFRSGNTYWATDGSTAGPTQLLTLPGFQSDSSFAVYQNELYFLATAIVNLNSIGTVPLTSIYATDGTAAGTQTFFEQSSIFAFPPRNLTVTDDAIYFTDANNIWKYESGVAPRPSSLQFAQSESTRVGIVESGTFRDTQSRDGVQEQLRETLVDGVAILDHQWEFDIPASDTATFTMVASTDSAHEDFWVNYSVDGGRYWRNMMTLDNTNTSRSFNLPTGTHGQVMIQVRDSNRSHDSTPTQVSVDMLTIQVDGEDSGNGGDPSVAFAMSESTRIGQTTAGDFRSTHVSDNVYETLQEALVDGVMMLDHTWEFEIPSGNRATFLMESRLDGSGEDFWVNYSTDGGRNYRNMLTLRATIDTAQTFTLPPGTSGRVMVQVRDSNRSGDSASTRLLVDRLAIALASQ